MVKTSDSFGNNSVPTKNSSNEEICFGKAYEVVRAMCGIRYRGVPKIVDDFLTFNVLNFLLKGDLSVEELAEKILGKYEVDYEEKIIALNTWKEKLNALKNENSTRLFYEYSSKETSESWIKSREIIFSEGYEEYLIRDMTVLDGEVSSMSPKDAIIKVYKQIIDNIEYVCSHSKYSNYLQTTEQKLIYVITLGGYSLSLPVTSRFVGDKDYKQELKKNKDFTTGLSIISCLTGADYSKVNIRTKLLNIELDLNEILYKDNANLMNNVKIKSFKIKHNWEKTGDTFTGVKVKSVLDFEANSDEITLDEAIKDVCHRFEKHLVEAINITRAGRSSKGHLSDEEIQEGKKRIEDALTNKNN